MLAPYYDYSKLIRRSCPVIMPFMVKYRIETHKYLCDCKTHVALFHGDRDTVIGYRNSMELCRLLKNDDIFITLEGEGHDSLIFNRKYKREMSRIL